MAILTKQDLIDSDFIKFAPNTSDRSIIPAISAALKFGLAEYLPAQMVLDLWEIHTTTDPFTAQQDYLLDYFNNNLKEYAALEAYYRYLLSSEAIQTASGFRSFVELQSDKASADVYAQLLSNFESLRNSARTLALAQLKKDNYTILDVSYDETKAATTPNAQKHFVFLRPCDNEYNSFYNEY